VKKMVARVAAKRGFAVAAALVAALLAAKGHQASTFGFFDGPG
jgi:hypothetical protein